MNLQKRIILGIFILLLLASTVFAGCGGKDMRAVKALDDLLKIIEEHNFDDLSLTIYYNDPLLLTSFPLSVDDLINFFDVKKIVINGSDLEEHIASFKQISEDDLVPVKSNSRINARFYYVFETGAGEKIFDVAMWGSDSSVFINGLEVNGNDLFFDIIIPFLPEDAVKDLAVYLGGTAQEASTNR